MSKASKKGSHRKKEYPFPSARGFPGEKKINDSKLMPAMSMNSNIAPIEPKHFTGRK
jgi:hypothetical protein